jgi:hypothetical protein
MEEVVGCFRDVVVEEFKDDSTGGEGVDGDVKVGTSGGGGGHGVGLAGVVDCVRLEWRVGNGCGV